MRLNADDIALSSSHLLKLETRSVTSARSQRSTGFASFFLRLRGKNDPDTALPEYEPGFPPYASLIGNSIDAEDDDGCDYDEEITLGSGFENMSLADSLDDSSVASDGTTQSKRSNGSYTSRGSRNSKSSARSLALAEQEQRQSPTKSKSSFLQRILSKNSGGQNDAIIRKAIGVSSSCTLSETESDEAEPPQSSASTTPAAAAATSSSLVQEDDASTSKKSNSVRRGKSLMHGSMKARSSKSLDGYPCVADIHGHHPHHRSHQDIVGPREINLRKDPPPAPKSTVTQRVASKKAVKDEDDDDSETTKTTAVDSSGLDRWDPDASVSSDSTLPKRPERQTSTSDSEQSSSEEDKEDPTAARPKKPTASQSMRNLHVDDEVDDESILSLLGGLLATWAAEREGAADEEATICTVDRDDFHDNGGEGRPKGILKTAPSPPSSPSPREGKEEEQRDPVSVIFDRVEIREYERVVGDNPSTARGPPISIGWLYKLAKVCPLDDYETMIRGPRRSKKEFHLSAEKRTHLLVEEWKCSEDDIRKARREATYIQYCRAKTSFSGSRVAAKEAAFLRKANDFRMQQQGAIMLSGTFPLDAPTSPSKTSINSPRPKTALNASLVGSSPKPLPRVKALPPRPPPISPVTNLNALPVVTPERTVRTLSPSPNAAPKTERPRALLEV